jgi:hypothetical protein
MKEHLLRREGFYGRCERGTPKTPAKHGPGTASPWSSRVGDRFWGQVDPRRVPWGGPISKEGRASRTIIARSDGSSGGLPVRRCGYVHRRATSCRCHRKSVSGLMEKFVQAARGSARLSAASSTRSARVSLGGEACRRRIANSSRRTRISSSFERCRRPAAKPVRTGSARRDTQTTRANQPSLTTTTSTRT